MDGNIVIGGVIRDPMRQPRLIGSAGMYGIDSGTVTFSDPQQYRAAVRPAQGEMLVTAKGDFRADLRRTQMPRLWMQSGRENLPRVLHVAVNTERPPIYFLADAKQAPTRHNGLGLSFGEIIVTAPGS